MDPLSDVIALLRPHAAFSKPITGRGRWGVRYAAHEAPGFCIVAAGRCWLTLAGEAPRPLAPGDFLLLPTTPGFTLSSHPDVPCGEGRPSDRAVHHGEPGEPDFVSYGGTFRVEQAQVPLLRHLLPAPLHVRAAAAETNRLARTIAMFVDEGGRDLPGRALVLERLIEIMLVEALRRPGSAPLPAGLVAGLGVPELADCLRAMHADVRRGWTVATLADRAGMSRSAFARHFTETVGCAPMTYLANWRMALAQDALLRGGTSQAAIAEAIGFESASAFNTAFRRRVGQTPGAYTRMHRVAPPSNTR